MNPKQAVLDTAFAGFREVARRTPKKHDLVLFGARRGRWYMDNSRQVYEWVLEHRPELSPVWITRNKDVVKDLKSRGRPVCHASSPKAFYLLARAPLAVTSTQLYDITSIPECPPDNLRVVFLGHGKSVKASSLAKKGPRSEWTKWLFKRKSELIDVGISTSPFISELSARSNGLTLEQYRDTGYPTNDLILRPTEAARRRFEGFLGGVEPEKVVLYAPTWRPYWKPGIERTRFFPFEDFDKKGLVRFLEESRILLLLRPHEIDLLRCPPLKRFLEEITRDETWIRMCGGHEIQDVNEVLPFTDALVSDYSSIYHDYLLLDRPILFVPYDYESFSEHYGFMFDYFEHLPGPVVGSQAGFLDHLANVAREEDHHREERHTLRSLIHSHTDGRATERVVQIIEEKLKGRNGDRPT